MDVELNTVIFYKRIKEVIKSQEVKSALDKILKEEEKHLIRLRK